MCKEITLTLNKLRFKYKHIFRAKQFIRMQFYRESISEQAYERDTLTYSITHASQNMNRTSLTSSLVGDSLFLVVAPTLLACDSLF